MRAKGVPLTKLAKEICEKTGMSYRWVMKYTPNELKVRPGTGGRKNQTNVARHATEEYELLIEPHAKVVNLVYYSNTNFVTVIMEKQVYLKLKEMSAEIGADLEVILNNMLLLVSQKLEKLAK